MGRLFWKFFAFFMLAQVATVVGVSSAIWLRHRNAAAQVASAPAAAERSDVAAAVLGHDGEAALRALLAGWSREPDPGVYAIDTNGSDILGRPVPSAPGVTGSPSLAPANPQSARRVVLPDGRSYLLFVDVRGVSRPPASRGPEGSGRREESGGPAGPGSRGRPAASLFPVEPIVGGLLASLVVAALLAWYVSKPIRSLRSAFDAAAGGDLDVRIGDGMGRRRDELADLGRAFDRTAVHLKLLMDGQRRLLHDVSHELRSPLARLQAAAGLARQQPGNIEASMDRIEREAMRMDKLVDELLTLSRVEAGMAAAHQENIDLVELVGDVVKDATFEADAGSLSVEFATDVEALAGLSVRGDPPMLHRALENVVRNGARHTPSGSRVRIVGQRDAIRREIELTVEDEGPGVAANELESIFAPFYRGTEAKGTRGHGLGLAIARRVIDGHGGSIHVTNRASGGLSVHIRLPV